MKKALAITSVVVLGLLAGCGSDDSDGGSSTSSGSSTGSATSSAPPDKGGPGAKVAYISPVAAQPGQQEINLGLEAGAEELDWETSVLDSNLSADKQVANIDTAITQGRNAVASWTLDPGAAAGAYQRAISQGIPVIGMNSEGEGVTSTVWWEYVTCEPGGPQQLSAEFIAEQRPGGKVIVMGGPPAPSILGQVKCFTAAAKEAGLEIVNQTDNTADTAAASQNLTQDLLTKYPDVDAFWNYNDQSALGESAAITGAGMKVAKDGDKDGIIVLGSNGDSDAIEAIRDGRLTGTWDPDNMASGMAAIKQMQTALEGGADKTYPALVVKSIFFTSKNIDEYKPAAERKYTLDTIPLAGG
ncbi:MAG TPA: sugar ABC transporter substrate-binding protein [Capillimicrobium sp.]|jgi:ribose transport system substrate-binding protein